MKDNSNITLTNDDFSWEFDMIGIKAKDIEQAKLIKQQILHKQCIVNRIEMIIKDKENEVEYMEKQYPNIESESHNLHHEWKAKLDDIDMFKRLLL